MSEETQEEGWIITPVARVFAELFSHLVDLQDLRDSVDTPISLKADLAACCEFLRRAAVNSQQLALAEADTYEDESEES